MKDAYIDPKNSRKTLSSSGDPIHQFCLYIVDVGFTFQWIILLTLCLKLNGLFFSIYANKYLVIDDYIVSMPQQSFFYIVVSFCNYILLNSKHTTVISLLLYIITACIQLLILKSCL